MSDDIDRASQNGRHQHEANSEPKKAMNAFEFILTFRHVKDLQFCRRGSLTRGSWLRNVRSRMMGRLARSRSKIKCGTERYGTVDWLGASCFTRLTLGTPLEPPPQRRVDRKPRGAPFPQIHEPAVIADVPIAEEPCQ